MRLMIVEDEQRSRRGLKSIIHTVSQEHEVIAEASNGRSALELIKVLKVDAVFTDIKMPYMDGLTLIKEVRKLGLDTKFVIVSAYEEFDYARQAISLGVKEYLVKPLIMEDVTRVLNALTLKVKKEGPVSLTGRYPDIHPIIAKSLKKIETDYGEPFGLKEISQEMEVSPEYFSSLFKKNVGESFVRFLRNYRIEIAKTFYCHGNVARDEVPYKVGYQDEKYFKRVFKEVTGISVSEFVREHKSDE